MKTCKRGHEFVRYERPDGKSGGCLECHRLRARTWNKQNYERYLANKRASYPRTAEHQKEKARQWQRENKDRARESGRAWALANPERVRENNRRWIEENPDRARELWRRSDVKRRSLKAVAHIPYGGLPAIYIRDGGKCSYCGDEVIVGAKNSDPKQATVDHIIPLILQGPDVESNVVLACRRCNSKKQAKVLDSK